ncbi:MAG: HD domain-containing protein [Candidatus Promineifilaceae bacterium]|nr:HD domain-containing protein [Candidatus Promineifilaceae bacterium]
MNALRKFVAGSAYRLEQFWQLVAAQPLSVGAWAEVESVLSDEEVVLFRKMSTTDQGHSLRVLRTLRGAGHADPDLLAAALLHDVGKGRVRLRLWERVLGAVVEEVAPALVSHWGNGASGEAEGWRRPFAIRARHAHWGAEMAAAAGSSPTTVALIRHHQEGTVPTADQQVQLLLRRLQWADNQN